MQRQPNAEEAALQQIVQTPTVHSYTKYNPLRTIYFIQKLLKMILSLDIRPKPHKLTEENITYQRISYKTYTLLSVKKERKAFLNWNTYLFTEQGKLRAGKPTYQGIYIKNTGRILNAQKGNLIFRKDKDIKGHSYQKKITLRWTHIWRDKYHVGKHVALLLQCQSPTHMAANVLGRQQKMAQAPMPRHRGRSGKNSWFPASAQHSCGPLWPSEERATMEYISMALPLK